MLTQYLTATQRLLQNPAAANPLYSSTDLTIYINTARGQLAGEAECIRDYATLAVTSSVITYPFASIVFGTGTGKSGVMNVRTIWRESGSGLIWVTPRSFEWFSLYNLNNPNPTAGPPSTWAQFGQGSTPQSGTTETGGGSIFVDPPPDTSYTLRLDTVCYPVPLVDDSTAEAIPYIWTDAVPYFAAYLAYLGSQVPSRQNDADRMFARYTEFMNRARRFATPSVMPTQYAPLPKANQFGFAPQPSGPPPSGTGGG